MCTSIEAEWANLGRWIVARVEALARRNATKDEWEKLGREIEARAKKLTRQAPGVRT
ncbi:hypothetical protein ES703_00778 [subsurface metagenome]